MSERGGCNLSSLHDVPIGVPESDGQSHRVPSTLFAAVASVRLTSTRPVDRSFDPIRRLPYSPPPFTKRTPGSPYNQPYMTRDDSNEPFVWVSDLEPDEEW